MGEYVGTDEVQTQWPLRTVDDVKANGKGALISGPFGSNISAKYFTDSGVPVIRGNNLSLDVGVKFKDTDFAFITPDKADELGTWAEPGDLLFTAVGTIGQVGYLTGKEEYPRYIISNKQIRLRLDTDKLLPLFAYFWFASPQVVELIQQRNTGSSVPLINLGVVRSLPVPVPDIRIQATVVEVLSSLDAKIDLLHRQNKTLEAMAEALFRQWFVEEAEDGWAEGTVADIADVTSGKRPPERFEESSSEARVPVWGGNGPMAYTREALVDSEVLLTGRVGTLGSIFRINTPIWPSDNTLLLTARRPEAMEFLFQQLRSIDFAQLNRGSTQPLLTQSDLKAQSFLMPPHELLTRYHEISRDWYAKVDANLKTIQTLTALRDTLLPKLMSGEVRVDVPAN